ncbi:hypothetical protein GGX14DRAFT_404224 [Mycena pura]|uniref:Uncharacterized protein n=1 Tax=Mycena pura TaxID=153505 RepID=A0AAD6UUY9_9AGAR|nr:hypothetical protein GGX14DRAFT_404224 [Mycena pura]
MSRRGRGNTPTAPTRQSTRKRTAPDAEEPNLEDAPAAKKPKRIPAPIEPRAPSDRAGRNIKPGEPDKPKEYRTHAAVQEEKDRAAAAEDKRQRLHAEYIANLAEIDADGDLARQKEEANVILTRDDLNESDSVMADGDTVDNTVLTINESDFERIDDDEAYRSEGDFVVKKKAFPKKKKKAAKGQTKAEINALAKTLLAEKMKADAAGKGKGKGKGQKKPVQDRKTEILWHVWRQVCQVRQHARIRPGAKKRPAHTLKPVELHNGLIAVKEKKSQGKGQWAPAACAEVRRDVDGGTDAAGGQRADGAREMRRGDRVWAGKITSSHTNHDAPDSDLTPRNSKLTYCPSSLARTNYPASRASRAGRETVESNYIGEALSGVPVEGEPEKLNSESDTSGCLVVSGADWRQMGQWTSPARAPPDVPEDFDAAAASKSAGLSKKYLAASAMARSAAESPVKPGVGGFDDEAANSTRPDFEGSAARDRRVNDLVTICDSSDVEADPTPTRTQAIPMAKRRAAPKPKTEPTLPALTLESDSKTPKSKKRVKEEASSDFFPVSSNDVKGLPALVGPTWESEFLPALYRALCISRHPLTFAAKGETAASQLEAVKAIQAVLDDIHPGSTLHVVWGDQICDRAVSRVRERRSLVAQKTLDVVKDFFAAEKYANDRTAIRTYARYAVRADGPGFWKTPTPTTCPCVPEAPGYLKPNGYLESPLIIAAAAMFLKSEEYSVPDRRGPDGGIERALKLYTATGVRAPVPKFTRGAVGTSVARYGNNIDRLTRSRWESLLAAAGASTDDVRVHAAEAMNDDLRDAIYIASSSPARY